MLAPVARTLVSAAWRLVSTLSALKPENSLPANALLLDEFLPSQIAAHSSRRQMALCHLASGWKLAPSAVSSSWEKYRWQGLRLDGSLSRYHTERPPVSGSA